MSLEQADALFHDGRLGAARKAFAELVERAQDKGDRATELIARIMLAGCAVRARDLDAARAVLDEVADQLDPAHDEAVARFRRVQVRIAVDAAPPDEARQAARDYLAWAEARDRPGDVLDACLLLSGLSDVEDRVEWLERGIERAGEGASAERMGRACTELAAALDQLDRPGAALDAYARALSWHRRWAGRAPGARARRAVVAATWAVGSCACRNEAWDLARDRLEEALALARADDDCADLAAWALADLARVYEEAGDVVGARHAVVEALHLARELELAALWPERYAAVLAQAEALDVAT